MAVFCEHLSTPTVFSITIILRLVLSQHNCIVRLGSNEHIRQYEWTYAKIGGYVHWE